MSEDFLTFYPHETKSCLEHVKMLRNEYVNAIIDIVDLDQQILEDTLVLGLWNKEIDDINIIVREHAKHVSVFALKFAPKSPTTTKLVKHHSDKFAKTSLMDIEVETNSADIVIFSGEHQTGETVHKVQDTERHGAALMDATVPSDGHPGRQNLQLGDGVKVAWQDTSLACDGQGLQAAWQTTKLSSGDFAGSQDDLYQDIGGLKTSWHDLYQVSVGNVETGLDPHKDSGGLHDTSQGLYHTTVGGLHHGSSQGTWKTCCCCTRS